MADRSGKTEEPTKRRLDKARKEGQFPTAKEFVGALQFLVFLGLLSMGGTGWFATLREITRGMFTRAFQGDLDAADLTSLARALFWKLGLPLATAGLAVTVATLAFRLATTQFGFSWKKLAPDLQRFNPLS